MICTCTHVQTVHTVCHKRNLRVHQRSVRDETLFLSEYCMYMHAFAKAFAGAHAKNDKSHVRKSCAK